MIGDAEADIQAAQDNEIHFIFRRHQDNGNLIIKSGLQTIDDFSVWKISVFKMILNFLIGVELIKILIATNL